MLTPAPPKQAQPDGKRAPPRSLSRFSSTDGGAAVIPTTTASPAALPTINNRILQQHSEHFRAMQQHMLQDHIHQHTCTDTSAEDDAPLPLAQYAGMSDILRPSRDPQTFDAWMADMQQKLQQRLRQCKGGKCAPVTGPAVILQGS